MRTKLTEQDFGKTNWTAFWAAMPTQLALVFFGILHVPLNVPALGVSLAEDNVNLDRELTAHGYTNLAAGALGVVPNYLCYVNTVLCEFLATTDACGTLMSGRHADQQSTASAAALACRA